MSVRKMSMAVAAVAFCVGTAVQETQAQVIFVRPVAPAVVVAPVPVVTYRPVYQTAYVVQAPVATAAPVVVTPAPVAVAPVYYRERTNVGLFGGVHYRYRDSGARVYRSHSYWYGGRDYARGW